MKKNLVVALLVTTMSIGMVTGCGGSKDASDKTETKTEETENDSKKAEKKEDKKEEALTEDLSEYGDIEWPDSTITGLIPKPKSMVGKISFETDTNIMVDIANTSDSDFEDYVEACKDLGYTVDYAKMDGMYSAKNDNGYAVVLSLDDDHVMSIMACEDDAKVGDITSGDSSDTQQ